MINFWIRDPENGQGNVKSEVNLAVLEVLKREGVEIPFPQRVVHAVVSPRRTRAARRPHLRQRRAGDELKRQPPLGRARKCR